MTAYSGRKAASAAEPFFVLHGITMRSKGTSIEEFRKLHRSRKLDTLIRAHELRERSGLVTKPTLASARSNLQPDSGF